MGNITSLGRYDNTGTTASPVRTQIDSLTYIYSHYKVTLVDDASAYAGTAGFQDAVKVANEYTYDGNGNELKDQNKGISSITYNLLNLPPATASDFAAARLCLVVNMQSNEWKSRVLVHPGIFL